MNKTRHVQIKMVLCYVLFAFCKFGISQQLLAPMPEPVTNNAVVGYSSDALEQFVYSFAGIGSGLKYSDVHQKCWKYDFFADQWKALPDLPSGRSRVAAGASVVKDKIYIMGGYHIFQNGNELSVNNVHILDITADTFLTDGKDIPVATDDHVQVVWRDSLIYLVTGWSQNTNISQVQVYDPSADAWSQATPVPNAGAYKVFGGSGCIVGDTIYYAGGARIGTNFPPTNYLRKGVINPDDPLEIEWTIEESDDAIGYRMASDLAYGQPVWLGGSKVTYNYDGIAYNGSGVVSPTGQVKIYNSKEQRWIYHNDIMESTMDFRGIAALSVNSWILTGGMKEDQEVTDECQLVIIPPLSNEDPLGLQMKLYPNPADHFLEVQGKGHFSWKVIAADGRAYRSGEFVDNMQLELNSWPRGRYIFQANRSGHIWNQIFLLP